MGLRIKILIWEFTEKSDFKGGMKNQYIGVNYLKRGANYLKREADVFERG